MSCAQPFTLETLVDYWFGDLPDDTTDRLEEHLLECDDCGDRLRALIALRDGVHRAGRLGLAPLIVTAEFLQAATASGLRVREYQLPPGGRVECTIAPDDDLLVGRMAGDFHDVERLDLTVEIDGHPGPRLEDIPIAPNAAELIWLQSTPASRALGHTVLHLRLLAVEGDHERLVGDYTFDHRPAPA